MRPSPSLRLAAAVLLPTGCHATWPGASAPSFPLVGLHAPLACAACHPADQPLGPLPTACARCHEGARPPDHYAGDCGECHTPYGWDDIVIDHGFFPLTGAHELACDACHAGGVYQGLDPACASCHEADRPADHFGAQDCGSCHTPTRWADATFDHDTLFPLPHHGVDDCASCHLEPGSYATFSCIDCHEHDKASTDRDHDEIGGYSYDSDACLRCHPRGDD